MKTAKAVSISKLSTGLGSAKAIEKGQSFNVMRNWKPVAYYRPYREDDEGETVPAATFYDYVGRLVKKVEKGGKVIVLRRGIPFATLCPTQNAETKAAKSRRQRRVRKETRKVPQSRTRDQFAPNPSDDTKNGNLSEAIRILQAADTFPPMRITELFELGASLGQQGKLDQGLALLRVLLD